MFKFIDKNEILTKIIFNTNSKEDELISSYFNSNNHLDYIKRFDNANDVQLKALDILFNDNSEMIERCQKAIDINKTCFEAYFILNQLSDTLSFYYDFLDIQNSSIENYKDEYELNDVINIKILISYYYSNIESYNKSLKVFSEIESYINSKNYFSHKLIIYNYLEDWESILKSYEETEFNNPIDFIVCIVCLLKNDKTDEARDILDDMLSKFEYAQYLCKPQELAQIDNEDSREMMQAMEICFDFIESIPYFFSWVSECIESKSELPN